MPRINQTNGLKSDQLTAPGSGSAIADTKGAGSLSCEVVVAAINTNVVVRLDYSDDRTFATGVFSSPATTLTANGSYVLAGVPAKRYARATFVSEAGGTAATIDFNINLFNSN